MSARPFDLVKILVALVILAIVLVAASFTPVKMQLVLPFVFFLPGYALTTAVFVDQPLDFLPRVILSLGFSLAIVVLGGFALNWTPSGLQPLPWALLIGSITLGSSIAAYRRSKGQDPSIFWRPALYRPAFSANFRQIVLLCLAVLVCGGVVAIAQLGIAREQRPGFTQLWMLPPDASGQEVIRLGVANREVSAVSYKLELSAGGDVLVEWRSIELEPGEQWETSVILPAWLEGSETIEVLLYRSDAPGSAYRRVAWWRAG